MTVHQANAKSFLMSHIANLHRHTAIRITGSRYIISSNSNNMVFKFSVLTFSRIEILYIKVLKISDISK